MSSASSGVHHTRPRRAHRALVLSSIATAFVVRPAAAQTPVPDDSSRARRIEPVVVTAERVEAALATATAAVTRLSAETPASRCTA